LDENIGCQKVEVEQLYRGVSQTRKSTFTEEQMDMKKPPLFLSQKSTPCGESRVTCYYILVHITVHSQLFGPNKNNAAIECFGFICCLFGLGKTTLANVVFYLYTASVLQGSACTKSKRPFTQRRESSDRKILTA
ncbi:hypothetical protein ACJX0J_014604, partial [Zea mays]